MIQKLLNFGKNNPQKGTVEFRMIGDRASGKTTYLAALAYWPISLQSNKSPILRVDPYDENTQVLISMAENILLQGDELDGSEEPILYSLTVALKPDFVEQVTRKAPSIRISCVDYPGEIFQNLRTNNPIVEDYLNDLQSAAGLLLLIDGTSQTDRDYAKAIGQLETKLNRRLVADSRDQIRNYRVAVVISKAELPQLWGSLDNLSDFMSRKFPYTQRALTSWKNQWGCQIEYFSCSAFGWMGIRKEPNVKGIDRGVQGTKAIIADPAVWKPAGLVQPIFWLKTGYRHRKLNTENL